eukprot:COSAG04_NODE_18483_length_440_cov_1.205279_1_plen_128_part_10
MATPPPLIRLRILPLQQRGVRCGAERKVALARGDRGTRGAERCRSISLGPHEGCSHHADRRLDPLLRKRSSFSDLPKRSLLKTPLQQVATGIIDETFLIFLIGGVVSDVTTPGSTVVATLKRLAITFV